MSSGFTSRDDAANRRARKRELDRQAQRAARERTRDRIACLEATVDALKQQKTNGVVVGLMDQLNTVTRQRNELARTLNMIESTLQVHRSGQRSENSTGIESPANGNGDWGAGLPSEVAAIVPLSEHSLQADDGAVQDVGVPIPEPWSVLALDHSEMALDHGILDSGITLDPFVSGTDVFNIISSEADKVIVPEPKHFCDCALPRDRSRKYSDDTAQRSIWRMANEVLGSRQMICRDTLHREGNGSEDIAIRIVLDGWNQVEASGQLTPFWKKLRQIDELQFRTCGATERLAILRTMHRVLCHQAEGSVDLPAWLQSRPSQALPHSSAIDFFVWPGVRERFVFSQHQYCSNHFWEVFAESFRIAWSFEFRDCYQRNVHTGQYSISPEFEHRIGDISAWTMTTEFFQHFPDLRSDIPAYISVYRPLKYDKQDRAGLDLV